MESAENQDYVQCWCNDTLNPIFVFIEFLAGPDAMCKHVYQIIESEKLCQELHGCFMFYFSLSDMQ